MDYLNAFVDYFHHGKSNLRVSFSPVVVQSLIQNYQDLQKDGIVLDIEPQKDVKEIIKMESDGTKTITYRGTYIYGFLKDNIFHELPGDLTTQTERKPMDEGDVVFTFDSSGIIIRIYESFAANTFGEKKKSFFAKIFK